MATMKDINSMFPDIVGQDRAKRELYERATSHSSDNFCPHIMLVAPKGCGKTLIASALSKSLIQKGETKCKSRYKINCASLKNLEQFFEQIVMPKLLDTDATVFFDECHMIPADIQNALLTVLNPSKQRRNTFSFGDMDWEVDFHRLTFIFATTESHKVIGPLMDRCRRIDLEDYTDKHLEDILLLNTGDKVKFDKKTLANIASALRGNGRSAQMMADDILSYCNKNHKKTFGAADWVRFRSTYGILPLGLQLMELRVMRALLDAPYTKLTGLAAKLGINRTAIQRDFEMYLQKQGLIEIDQQGRMLTQKGREYLKEVDTP